MEDKFKEADRLLELCGGVLALVLVANVDVADGDSEIVGKGRRDEYPERERKLILNPSRWSSQYFSDGSGVVFVKVTRARSHAALSSSYGKRQRHERASRLRVCRRCNYLLDPAFIVIFLKEIAINCIASIR